VLSPGTCLWSSLLLLLLLDSREAYYVYREQARIIIYYNAYA